MGHNRPVGSVTVARQREQERGLEPTAMLIAAFKVHIALERLVRPADFLAARNDSSRRTPGIDPHVKRVIGFCDGLRAIPARWLQSGPQFSRGFLEPNI